MDLDTVDPPPDRVHPPPVRTPSPDSAGSHPCGWSLANRAFPGHRTRPLVGRTRGHHGRTPNGPAGRAAGRPTPRAAGGGGISGGCVPSVPPDRDRVGGGVVGGVASVGVTIAVFTIVLLAWLPTGVRTSMHVRPYRAVSGFGRSGCRSGTPGDRLPGRCRGHAVEDHPRHDPQPTSRSASALGLAAVHHDAVGQLSHQLVGAPPGRAELRCSGTDGQGDVTAVPEVDPEVATALAGERLAVHDPLPEAKGESRG